MAEIILNAENFEDEVLKSEQPVLVKRFVNDRLGAWRVTVDQLIVRIKKTEYLVRHFSKLLSK